MQIRFAATRIIADYGSIYPRSSCSASHAPAAVASSSRAPSAANLMSCALHCIDYILLAVGDNAAGELVSSPSVVFNLWDTLVSACQPTRCNLA